MAGPGAQVLPQQLVMIDEFLMDVSLNEGHEFESEVTEFPVESGSNIVDNVRPKPITVTMECLVSNTPIGFLATTRGTGSGSPSDPVDDAYEHLLKIRERREPVTIRTSLRTFENMVLKSLSIPRSSGRGDELRFTATFQQIQVVTNKRVRRVAVINGGKKKKFGASPLRLIVGNRILWRKGKPPGAGPDTNPRGEIVGEEVLIMYQKAGTKGAPKLCHLPTSAGADPQPLSESELAAFRKDWERETRDLRTVVAAELDRPDYERTQELLDPKVPVGKKTDAAMFYRR